MGLNIGTEGLKEFKEAIKKLVERDIFLKKEIGNRIIHEVDILFCDNMGDLPNQKLHLLFESKHDEGQYLLTKIKLVRFADVETEDIDVIKKREEGIKALRKRYKKWMKENIIKKSRS